MQGKAIIRAATALLAVLVLLVIPGRSGTARAAEFPTFKTQEIDPHIGNVCYAVITADVNGDGKLDAVAVAEDAVYWYENPSWTRHTIIKNATDRDNVCIQPHDIDGDGQVDFALGAFWQPSNTRTGGTIQWLKRGSDLSQPWKVIPIGSEPTVHRMRWGDPMGTGKPQLIVAPLQGRGTKGPNWGEGQGVRVLVYTVPADPVNDPWKFEVADETLHTTHNLQLVRNSNGRDDIVIAGWEGVFNLRRDPDGHWLKTQLGTGNQQSSPSKGSSEVKVGKTQSGRYIATIEPWHGYQVVVYTPPNTVSGLGTRTVIDEPVQWGHAVWCADLDGDGDDELIIGQRDKSKDPNRKPTGPGVFVYDPKTGSGSPPLTFTRHVIDDGGIGCEDLVAADLNNDGRLDILAGGRSTHNVRIYWNQGMGK